MTIEDKTAWVQTGLLTVVMAVVALSLAWGGCSVLARFGVGIDWYCEHLSLKNDTFCIVRELKRHGPAVTVSREEMQ